MERAGLLEGGKCDSVVGGDPKVDLSSELSAPLTELPSDLEDAFD